MRNGALSRSSSVQHILRVLRRDIIRYRYKDGQQIRELELAAKYDASRAAVRGALMVLEKEGLIVTHKNGTRTVSCLSRADMDNYHDLRAYLETVAVEEVARGDKNMEGIFEVVNKIRMLDERNTHEEIQQLNSDFHGSIILASGNKAVIQAWSNIEDVMREVTWEDISQATRQEPEHFKQVHTELFMALMQGSGEAVRIYKEHLESSRMKSLKNYYAFLSYMQRDEGVPQEL